MIPALGAGGREFDSRITPTFCSFLAKTLFPKNMMQSVGIEPTLLRTRALSVRLNRSAKTASVQCFLRGHFLCLFTQDRQFGLCVTKKEVLPGLEPGLQGSEPWVLTNYPIEPVTIARVV